MGCCQSVSNRARTSLFFGELSIRQIQTGETGYFMLKKKRPGCSGMFWREDPSKSIRASILKDTNWPRDNAIIEGEVIKIDNGKAVTKWLKARSFKQAGDANWQSAPEGAYMPFEHDDHYYLEKSPETSQ